MLRPSLAPSSLALTGLALILALALAGPAAADCYADYKAKRDDPLKLAYGVAQIPDADCDRKAARKALAPRLEAGGWKLLDVVSVFGPEGLAERKDRAGENYLRY